MLGRRLLQFFQRVPEQLHWRVPLACYCDKQGMISYKKTSEKKPEKIQMDDIMRKEAEEYLANLDETALRRMEDIKDLMQTLRFENKRVPDSIPLQQWKTLLTEHHSYSSRVKFLAKLYLDEIKSRNSAERQATKNMERQQRESTRDEQDLPQFSIHYPDRDKYIKRWAGITALQSDINVVFDLNYEQKMREQIHTFDQVQLLWSNNLKHVQPLKIHLTSVHKNERLTQLLKTNPTLYLNTYEEHFSDVFSQRQDLVYLSPDGPQMREFNPNCTYIIGGIVDLSGKSRLTFGTARKLGIKCASFPIKTYCDLSYRYPKTVLTLNCVYGILQDMYLHHSWQTAFRNNLRSSYVLYEDTKKEAFTKKRNEMIEKQLFKTFLRNQNALK